MKELKFLFRQLLYALIFVVILLLGLLYYLDIWTRHGEQIVVPELKEKTLSQVEEILKEHKLRFEVMDSAFYNPKLPKFAVIKQSPQAGEKVKENRKIYLTINPSDYPKVTVPKVIQITYRNAISILKSVGLNIGQVTYVDDIGKDMVLRVFYKGKEISSGDLLPRTSVVDLECGNGNNPSQISEQENTDNQELLQRDTE